MNILTTVVLSLPMLLGGFIQLVISQFYQNFATDKLLLDAAAVGSIFFISRLSDAVLDPICGYLSDKLHSRRTFIGFGLLALTGGVSLAFLPSALVSPPHALSYALAASGIFITYLGITLLYIPHYAWLAERQREATQHPYFAARAVLENFGTVCGGLALLLLVKQSGATLFISIVTMVCTLAVVGSLPLMIYRDRAVATSAMPSSFMRSLRAVGSNRPYRLVAAMSFCNQFAATMLLATSLYYTDYVLGNKELGASVAVVFLLSATICVPLWSVLGRRFNRHTLWNIALVLIILIFPSLFLAERGFIWYLTVFAVVVGGAAGAVILFVPQEISFLTSGKGQDEGLYFAAFTFVNKSAMACVPLAIGLALKLANYSPNARTPIMSYTITFLFIGLPALAFLLSAVLLRIYVRTSNATPLLKPMS